MQKIKTYKDALDYIFSKLPIFQRQGPKALKYDLKNIESFCEKIGNPQNDFKSIHIAGTNGKGTTSHAIASIFQEAGYKTGLYTSPHYKDFRERIKLDGKFISKSYVKEFIITNLSLIEEIKPSYFELSVAIAFKYFSDKKVDIAIIEVGLGGRLDSTNIITPILSVITNISFDHTQTLGNTLPEIAKEKGGIIKNKIPVLIGDTQVECVDTFEKIASEKKAAIFYSEDLFKIEEIKSNLYCKKFSLEKNPLDIHFIKTDIMGPFSYKNITYALSSISIINRFYKNLFSISSTSITKGLRHVKRNTKYIGRWHLLSKSPLVVADGAHNIGSIKETIKYVSTIDFEKLHIILGVVEDKSWEEIFKLLPQNAIYYFTKAKIPRAMDENLLKKIAQNFNLKGKAFSNSSKAKESAINNANKTDLVLIIGSIYLVGEII